MNFSLLNENQKKAVMTTEGPVLILAGAGSGKTRTLAFRIGYLIEKGVSPENILAITFTNKAANEMKERIKSLIKKQKIYLGFCGTFHSLGAKILRENSNFLKKYFLRNKNFVIFDEDDSLALIKKIIKDIDLSSEQFPPRLILNQISFAKTHLLNEEEYQTVFSEKDGAVAAPTAGLHFTEDLLEKVKEKGVKVVYITLHVGLGTFRPVKETIEKHKMHREEFFISEETTRIINESKMAGGKVFACGTTTVRALETAATFNGVLKPMKGKTRLFIKPGYPFKVVDAIITNFHFPRTTLLMLVAAFAGKDFILDAYNVAVKECYRFYSFGDAMLII